MKTKTIITSSKFHAGKEEVFCRLQKLETLQYIAAPFARFIPLGNNQITEWKEGATLSFQLHIFGKIPFGAHTIRVLSFNKDSGINTREYNKYVPIWNHRIYLESIDENTTRYTDEVEVGAGWKTPFVALWAKMFYAHRQRKWKKLLQIETNKQGSA
ncbi:MAG TPA: hypothetical protein PK385_07765 [Spirochaetota bacterium]|nr:hypothetical protein [Spirochaetota bacterium]HOS32606.1 hypothetical protein [Spirochaetota bacterium]HOS55939.1 hypothetical protein [Spirochaetota bacterium]HPK62556.1 hypothetical protein [Spirochaetota bacterium]HQF77951.1 hypothetical protein [Spirochaetota bacterium]